MTSGVRSFRFDAVDGAGLELSGDVDAPSEREARSQLARRGLLLLSLRSRAGRGHRRTRLSAPDVATGLRILADLLEARLTVARALATFEELAPAGWRAAIPGLREAVREGATLSDALHRAPIVLPALVLGIVRAGEAGDGLAAALRRAAEHAQRTAEMHEAIRGALAYPAIVAVTGAASISLMLTVVLPRFAALLADLGQDLPASTARLLTVAGFLRSAFPAVLLGLAAVGAAVLWSGRRERLARQRSRVGLALPVIGALRRSILDARVATALGALLGSGVPVRQALGFAADSCDDAEIRARVLASAENVLRGEALSSALENQSAVAPATVRMIRVGEQTGRVSEMCSHAAQMERARSERSIRGLVRMLEPALILIFAAIVGFVAVALLQAVYAVRPQ